jgi:type IV secretory pathway VirB4 component
MMVPEKNSDLKESPIFEHLTVERVILNEKGLPGFYHNDGSFSMVIELDGINTTALDDAQFATLNKAITNTLSSNLNSSNITVQFALDRREVKKVSIDEDITGTSRLRAEYLNELVDNGLVYNDKYYVTVLCSAPEPSGIAAAVAYVKNFTKFMSSGNLNGVGDIVKNSVQDGVRDRVRTVSSIIDAMVSNFKAADLSSKKMMKVSDCENFLQMYTRRSQIKDNKLSVGQTDERSTFRQKLFSGVRGTNTLNDLVIDGVFHRFYGMEQVPKDFVDNRSIEVIQTIKYEFLYTVTFRMLTEDEVKKALDHAIQAASTTSELGKNAGGRNRMADAQASKVSDMYTYFAETTSGQAVNASVNLLVFMDDNKLKKFMELGRFTRPEAIRELDTDILSSLRRFGNSVWATENGTSLFKFFALMPGCASVKKLAVKADFVALDHLPCLLALSNNQKKLPFYGANYFLDYRGALIPFDIMDPSLEAWNYGVFGGSGSGKSFLINSILNMIYAVPKGAASPIVCIMDVGGDNGSYTKMIKANGGEVISLSSSSSPRIQLMELNPLKSYPVPSKAADISKILVKHGAKISEMESSYKVKAYFDTVIGFGSVITDEERRESFVSAFGIEPTPELYSLMLLGPGDAEPNRQQMNSILGVISSMLSSAPGGDGFAEGVCDRDNLSNAITDLYRNTKNRFPYLSDLIAQLNRTVKVDEKGNKDESGLRVIEKLRSWSRDSARPMFDLDTSVNMASRSILVDFIGLKSDKSLQSIYTLLFTTLFAEKMYFEKNCVKVMVRDEAWSIMTNAAARDAYLEDLATARKNGFATISATQSPFDYLSDDRVGKRIMTNTTVYMLGRFKAGVAEQTGEVLGLPSGVSATYLPNMGTQMKTLDDGSTVPTHASFAMLSRGEFYVLNNVASPEEYWLYTTSDKDKAIIDYYMKVNRLFNDYLDLAKFLGRKQHYGDAGLIEYLRKANKLDVMRKVMGPK